MAIAILSLQGYMNRHLELCKTHKTQYDAFEALEEEYKLITGVNKYSSYESFKVIKTRYYQRNR